ncbi:Bifunctional NAD(P)H-hydrate repair enzyme Nnr [Arenibacter antarcticus]|uniref:Bifunctional NAD(P)H-hydrate repair enzyme n=1 Tax=Arenibacter antarcticus TaxID=2040469 RepID=A0ABW5VM33_9FLAO|nr:NAD(P)H-hydrate dehydratase [Arenibacter sp. H213]MCM4168908.1 bifunctional ADP-dependent NAD(P)H-hydrate dehydratase/NAD(P)H-hydrate epimerase [Arenibacter sp. H213]
MKIFNTKEIYEADKFTLERQQISAEDLMEKAAVQIFNWMHTRLNGDQTQIYIFCGVGNNGGDGLVLARHLVQHGYRVTVCVVNFNEHRSKEFLINLDRLKEAKVWPKFLGESSIIPQLEKEAIIVDAIFGIGLKRAVAPWVLEVFREINKSNAFVLSIDIPSGLFMDHKVPNNDEAVKSSYLLSFQVPKLIFFLPDTGLFLDQWELLDIGLDTDFLMHAPSDYELIGKAEVLPFYRPRTKYTHKGTYGHVLIIGGSYGKIGAVLMAAKGSLYAGSGLVTAFVPKCGLVPLQSAFPELMVLTDINETEITNIDFNFTPTVIGIGVGMGTGTNAVKAFSLFLKNNKTPLVIDADGLNILAKNPDLFSDLPPQTVLTPHPKELERMLGKWKNDFDKLIKTKEFSKKHDCIVVIKGAHTITVYGDKGYVNSTGNPGMATGGSGDVLTGVITGLLAQGYATLEAAVFGVYLHGRAADIAIRECGFQALVATDIIAHLGKAYLDLFVDQVNSLQDEQA